MNWTSWSEFFAMGGYALYVWGAVLAVLGGMGGEVWSLRRRAKAARCLHAGSAP